jgi:hypothetical protein
MKGEIAVEPLGVGYFHKFLDEVLHLIVPIDVGACYNTNPLDYTSGITLLGRIAITSLSSTHCGFLWH